MSNNKPPLPTGILQYLLCAVLAACLPGCGFHLRGAIELPPEINRLAIEDLATGSEIAPVLKLQLRRVGIKKLHQPEDASLLIVVQGEQYKRRVLTVSAAGQVQEYELGYLVYYSIKNVEHMGASLLNQKIEVRRDLRFDATQVLSKAAEESRLKQDMINTAAEQILRRLPKVVPARQ